jgi:hypothetical protein
VSCRAIPGVALKLDPDKSLASSETSEGGCTAMTRGGETRRAGAEAGAEVKAGTGAGAGAGWDAFMVWLAGAPGGGAAL